MTEIISTKRRSCFGYFKLRSGLRGEQRNKKKKKNRKPWPLSRLPTGICLLKTGTHLKRSDTDLLRRLSPTSKNKASQTHSHLPSFLFYCLLFPFLILGNMTMTVLTFSAVNKTKRWPMSPTCFAYHT
jgi:hypothetical protein